MAQKQKLHVKVGDQVTIISGFYKNETGEVIKVDLQTKKVIVFINFNCLEPKLAVQILRSNPC